MDDNEMPHLNPQRTLFTVKQLVALPEFGFLTESSLRHMIFASRSTVHQSGAGHGLLEAGWL